MYDMKYESPIFLVCAICRELILKSFPTGFKSVRTK